MINIFDFNKKSEGKRYIFNIDFIYRFNHLKKLLLYMLDEQIEIESLQRHNKERLAENSHSQGNSKTAGNGRF